MINDFIKIDESGLLLLVLAAVIICLWFRLSMVLNKSLRSGHPM